MKKLILSLFLMAGLNPLFAQSVHFDIKGGLNLSTMGEDALPPGNSKSSLTGFNAGAFAGVDFNSFSIQPGVYYTTKGFKASSSFTSNEPAGAPSLAYNIKGTRTFNYLEIPLNVFYNIHIAPGKIFFGGGPYWALGLSGKAKSTEITNGAVTDSYNRNFSFGGADNYKKSDLGINGEAGISLKNGLLLSVDYGYGLVNIINGSDQKFRNRTLSLSVGYSFI
jgi:hypothetical protein